MSPRLWNAKFKLYDGFSSESDIHVLFWVYRQKHDRVTDNSPIIIYVNKIENRIPFKTKRCHYIKLLTSKMNKLLGNTKVRLTKNKNGEIFLI